MNTTIEQLGKRLRFSGSQSLALSTVLTNALRIISTMCLTRLLSPAIYGITGLIVSIFYVITMLSDVGFQAYIVRHDQGDDQHFIDAVWTIHAARGVVLTVVAILLAWPLSIALAQPRLTWPLAIASFTFLIEGQGSLGQFRALRVNGVRRFALMDLLTASGQILAAIALAVAMRNVWAIIISMLIASLIRVWLSYLLFPGNRRSLRVNPSIASDLWRFSRMIAASSALTLVISQVDKLAMSRILSLDKFGTYVIASTLAAAPTAFAYNYTATIVYPAAAAAWRERRSIKDAYYRCWGRFFYAYLFGGGLLIGGASLLIRMLYDRRYMPAASFLSILAVATALTMSTRSMMEILVASGRPRAAVELNLVRLAWLIAGGLIAMLRGDTILFVATIGLIEVPVYAYAAFKMARLELIRWRREVGAWTVIAAGFASGFALNLLAEQLLSHIQ